MCLLKNCSQAGNTPDEWQEAPTCTMTIWPLIVENNIVAFAQRLNPAGALTMAPTCLVEVRFDHFPIRLLLSCPLRYERPYKTDLVKLYIRCIQLCWTINQYLLTGNYSLVTISTYDSTDTGSDRFWPVTSDDEHLWPGLVLLCPR